MNHKFSENLAKRPTGPSGGLHRRARPGGGGGYTASVQGASLFAEADAWTDLKTNVRDAVRCHFGDADAQPRFTSGWQRKALSQKRDRAAFFEPGHTSSPTDRINSMALLLSTTPGRIL